MGDIAALTAPTDAGDRVSDSGDERGEDGNLKKSATGDGPGEDAKRFGSGESW
jgi:hypothetical protein